MSKYGKYDNIDCKDAECLLAALRDAGYQPEYHSEPVNLYGYLGDMRPETAEIVIPRKQVGNAANDIGFKLQPGGHYTAIISEFDRTKYNDAWLRQLRLLYGEKHSNKAAAQVGAVPIGRKVVNGKIQLQYIKY